MDRTTVWAALNNEHVLKNCIRGCEELSWTGESELSGAVRIKVGPVNSLFRGKILLENVRPQESYRLTGKAQGKTAGFARGQADVRLEDADGGGTRLTYEIEALTGGKLAQVGSRLIQGTARKYADDFFTCFEGEAMKHKGKPTSTGNLFPPGAPAGKEQEDADTLARGLKEEKGIPVWLWPVLVAALVLGSLYIFAV